MDCLCSCGGGGVLGNGMWAGEKKCPGRFTQACVLFSGGSRYRRTAPKRACMAWSVGRHTYLGVDDLQFPRTGLRLVRSANQGEEGGTE